MTIELATYLIEIAVLFSLIGIHRELRMIRKRLGGKLAFWPWNDE